MQDEETLKLWILKMILLSPSKRIAVVATGALMIATLFAAGANAEVTEQKPGEVADLKPTISGPFFVAPARLSDEEIAAFLKSPDSLLEQFVTGGLPMSTRVRSLAGSSPDTLDPILALVPKANIQQIAAIGAGLARAARALTTINPEYAALIQEKIVKLNDDGLSVAFVTATGEVQTAALGAGGGGAGAGGGASGIGGNGQAGGGAAGAGGDAATATTTQSFSGAGSSQFFASDNAGDSTSVSVSPE